MSALDGTVKLPGMGTVPKKYVALAAAVGAGIVGVGLYRKRQAQNSAIVVAPSTDGTDPFNTAPVGPGGDNGVTNQFGEPVAPPIVNQTPGIVTNQDWITAGAAQDLGGIDSSVISAALSHVLGGIPVTQAQAEIFHEVVGIIGPPPQSANAVPKITSTPPPPPTSAPAKPKYAMQWAPVTVTGSYVGLTLGALQDKYAHDAAAVGATKLTTAVLADYRRQAATRNAMPTTTKLRNGQMVSIRRAVKT